LNIVLKLIWGKRLMQLAKDNGKLGEDQHGSRSERRASDAVMEKIMIYDFARITRTNVITIDNDAKACYDRIIRVLAMIACMCLGLPREAATMHNKTHDGMVHRISTLHGISAVTYSAQDEGAEPLEGTGQGSGASPAIWTIVCVSLLRAFAKFAKGITILDPAGTLCLNIAVYYVDDGMPGVNDFSEEIPELEDQLISKAQESVQSWSSLLYGSGGSLVASKCFTYMIIHDWKSGSPILKKPEDVEGRVQLTDYATNEQFTLPCIDPEVGTRTLGVRIAPSGNWDTEYQHRCKQSKALAHLMDISQFTRDMADIALRQVIMPALEYPLNTASFNQKQCTTIQRPILKASLRKWGTQATFPEHWFSAQ
jgi:hypothetical protein